jgi:prepilin peptidase CpaA
VPLTDGLRFIVAVAFTLVIAYAAFSDIKSRRIPNWTVIAVIGLFVIWAGIDGGRGAVSALEAAGVALVVSVALYAFKIMGAGDSKLFTAVALFAGMGYLPLLIVATTLAGGVIALVSLASRPQRAMVMFSMRGKGDWGRGVPYGVAIAVGGALIVWAPMTGLVQPLGARPHVSAADIGKALRESDERQR